MYHLNCVLRIGDYVIDSCHNVEIMSSWQKLTDTCVIELPRQLQFEGKNVKELIKVGMAVSVKLGYGELKKEFSGVICSVSPKIPFIIRCEDGMKSLKGNNAAFAGRNVMLAALLSKILPSGVVFSADNIRLGAFRVNGTAAKALGLLRQSHGIYSFFRDGVLMVGFPPSGQKSVKYSFQDNIISHGLEYRIESDRRFRVRCVSVQASGERLVIERGDDDGELRTFHYYEMEKEALIKVCESKLVEGRYEGYRGYFTTFGVPFVSHGDIAVIEDSVFPERSGSYRIDGIETVFGYNGFRRRIRIGIKL